MDYQFAALKINIHKSVDNSYDTIYDIHAHCISLFVGNIFKMDDEIIETNDENLDDSGILGATILQ